MNAEGDGAGNGGDGGKATENKEGGSSEIKAVMDMLKTMQTEIAGLKKGKSKDDDDDDPILKEIERKKAKKTDDAEFRQRISTAVKFNDRLENFLKEYSGVLPSDANDIPNAVNMKEFPDDIERAKAAKASLVLSFFKEEKNLEGLTESQRARYKVWAALGKQARHDEVEPIYESVFEPAVNQARAVRQAQLRAEEDGSKHSGSKDSDIIFRKHWEKSVRSVMGFKLNDELHEQAKKLGLVAKQS